MTQLSLLASLEQNRGELVVRRSGRARRLSARVYRDGRVEVVEGLPPAAQVLAARFDNLREGASATVVAARSAAAVASASAAASVRQ